MEREAKSYQGLGQHPIQLLTTIPFNLFLNLSEMQNLDLSQKLKKAGQLSRLSTVARSGTLSLEAALAASVFSLTKRNLYRPFSNLCVVQPAMANICTRIPFWLLTEIYLNSLVFAYLSEGPCKSAESTVCCLLQLLHCWKEVWSADGPQFMSKHQTYGWLGWPWQRSMEFDCKEGMNSGVARPLGLSYVFQSR